MCGIVGLISTRKSGFQQDDLKLFSKMLVIDGLNRGMDSTGVFQVTREGDVYSMKNSVNPMVFQADKQYLDFMETAWQSGRVIIGHNRAATQGAVVPDNAHPFHFENICLVHNGTLHNHKTFKDTDVDSAAVAHALAEEGADPKEIIPKVRGAFTFVWYDQNKEKLYFIRNSQRPLEIAEFDGGMILSSEGSLTSYLCARAKIPLKGMKEIPPEHLFCFDMGTQEMSWEKLELSKAWTHTTTYPLTGGYSGNVSRAGGTVTSLPAPATTRPSGSTQITATVTRPSSQRVSEVVVDLAKDVRAAFKPSDIVMIKIDRITSSVDSSQGRWTGRVIEPGKPVTEAAGVFDTSEVPPNVNWYSKPIIGEVSHIVTTNCGPSIHIKHVRFDTEIQLHNGVIGEHELKHVVKEEPCEKCANPLDARYASVMSIARSGLGVHSAYRCICQECVEKSIKEKKGKIYDDYKARLTAVQTGIELREKLSIGSISTDSTPSPSNLLH